MARHPRVDALSCWQRLNEEYGRYKAVIRVLPMDQLKVQDDLRRYLCLRCAGFLEQVTFVTIRGYLEQKSGGPVLEFSKSWFKQAPNLTASAFTKLMERFGESHRTSFSQFLTPVRKEALSDLLEIRNDVAHGKSFEGAKLAPERYIKLCEEAYDWLVETFLGESIEVLDDAGKRAIAYERSPQ